MGSMNEKTEGPRVRLELRCNDCKHCKSEYYYEEDGNSDYSGHIVSCVHPSINDAPRRIGDTSWLTPSWCPLRKEAVLKMAESIQKDAQC